MASSGQAAAHGVSAQCRQDNEKNLRTTSGNVPVVSSTTFLNLIVPAGMPFHCWQAISQAQHLMHRPDSKEKLYCLFIIYLSSALLILTKVCFAIWE